MKFLNATIALVLGLAVFSDLAEGQEVIQEFDSDLGDLISNRDIWRWTDRASLDWQVPAGSDGFAVVSDAGEGDELYNAFIDIQNGLTYEIRFFFASQYEQSTTFQVQQLTLDGQLIQIINDVTHLSSPLNDDWITIRGTVAPSNQPSRFGVFCQTGAQNSPGGYLWGCAIDYMKIDVTPEATTPVPTPAPTSPEPTTPQPTTPQPTTPQPTTPRPSTPQPTTPQPTTPQPTTPPPTTPQPTTPQPTTPQPTTPQPTTPQPTTPRTTPEPTPEPTTLRPTTPDATTPDSGPIIDWSFNSDTAGWILGRSNGAAWQRLVADYDGIVPLTGDYALQVIPSDEYSSTVLAMSPRLVAGSSGSIRVDMEFFMNASQEYPTYLKVRRRLSYTQYDDEPIINLDGFGNQANQHWLSYYDTLEGMNPGEEFNLVIEGSLGIDNTRSIIAVSRIVVTGATEIEYEEEDFFDFSDGLVGWQAGSLDGGKWQVYPYTFLNPGLNIPQPSSGDLLLVERFDIHSGVISIESPPIAISPLSAKRINSTFWIRGSQEYPVNLRFALKTLDGVYDEFPFLELYQYGDDDMQDWMTLQTSHFIPADPRAPFFQLIVEVELGADMNNLIAIDNIELISDGPRSQ